MTEVARRIEEIFRNKSLTMWNDLVYSGLLHDIFGRDFADAFICCPQVSKWHPEGSLHEHMKCVFKNAVNAKEVDLDLYWICLLHDCMKPVMIQYRYDEKGTIERTSFHGHDIAGAGKAKEILTNIGMTIERIEKIVWIIKQHMRIAQISNMKTKKVEELINHSWFNELCRFHNYDDMIEEISPDCVWVKHSLKDKK